jgi:gas vesicle protein
LKRRLKKNLRGDWRRKKMDETERIAEEIAEDTVEIVSEKIGRLEERIRNLEISSIESERMISEKHNELLIIIQELKDEVSSIRNKAENENI